MKKLTLSTFIMVFIILFNGCSKEQKNNYGFFAWMDSYIAVESNSDNVIAVTLFFEKPPFEKADVVSVTFDDLQEEVEINNFSIDDSSQKNGDYDTYSFTLDYTPKVTGIYDTSGVIIVLSNNKSIKYPIGNWVFDINEQSAEFVDSWNSAGASTNAEEFPYDYSIKNGDIKKIYYGNNKFFNDFNGTSKEGIISIKDDYSSPIVYIKSKIEVTVNGVLEIDYGKGCYCGALDFSEDGLIASKKRNSIDQ